MKIEAKGVYFTELNKMIRNCNDDIIELNGVEGQRYIGSGVSNKKIIINGTPGNALGAYLSNNEIIVYGNAQDATGDTMDSGNIVVYGNCGDTTGYAMRGGSIYVKGNAGYRVGIHMKEYMEHKPVIVIGGKVGDFLGEYQAGGIIIVLGLNIDEFPVGSFCGTGMHGGRIYIRCNTPPSNLPKQVICEKVEDVSEISEYIKKYCTYFDESDKEILNSEFYVLKPNSKNPYRQLYTHN